MRHKRLILALVTSTLLGILCAYMATIFKPVEITTLGLIATVYNRSLTGLFIGLLSNLKIFRNEKLNCIARGGLVGFLISWAMVMPFGLKATMFSLFGFIYGTITDLVATFLTKRR